MWRTYVHMTGQDIDTEVARVYGIVKTDEKEKESGIRPRQCQHCSTINPPIASTCYTCGEPLDAEGIMKLEEIAKYIVQHGDSLKKYIDSIASAKTDGD